MPLLLCLCLTGLPECSSTPRIYSPLEILNQIEELYHPTINPNITPPVVRFQTGYIDTMKVHIDPENRTYTQLRIHPLSEGINNASFHIAITPEAEKEFKRLGITDLKKHFQGKEIEVQGRISLTLLHLYASPTFYFYHIEIESLDQIRMIKPVSDESSEPEKE